AVALAVAPATALAAPVLAAPLTLEPADPAQTGEQAQPDDQAEPAPGPADPIHGGGGSHHLSHGGGSHHLSHGGLPSTGSAF
ncbi:hypothetical protein ACWEO7_32715, partial [Nocardia sp. NPDC004260]